MFSASQTKAYNPKIKYIILPTKVSDKQGKAFIDCGCSFNAITVEYAERCNIPFTKYEDDLVCVIGDGNKMTLQRRVARVKFEIENLGIIDTYVFVMDKLPLDCDVLFGMDFLSNVNPKINWKSGKLSG